MGNWAFEIDHADDYIVGLTEVLVDKGFRISCFFSDDHPQYLFSSAYLIATPDEQVPVQARQLVKFIDGLSYLLFENKESVNKVILTTAIDMNTFGIAPLQRANHIPATVSIDFSEYTPLIEDEENPMAHLLKLVAADVFIRDLLWVLSQGMGFKEMHQAFSLLKSKLDGLGFAIETLVRFVQTARQEDIDNPMPLKVAQELITDIIFVLLEKKYRIHLRHCVVKDRNAAWDDMYDSLYD